MDEQKPPKIFVSKRLFLNLERVLYIRETPNIAQEEKSKFLVYFDTGATVLLTTAEAEGVLKAVAARRLRPVGRTR